MDSITIPIPEGYTRGKIPIEIEEDVAHQYLVHCVASYPGRLEVVSHADDPEGAHYPDTDPRHQLRDPVVAIEPSSMAPEWVKAISVSGWECNGSPNAVLTRCLWRWMLEQIESNPVGGIILE